MREDELYALLDKLEIAFERVEHPAFGTIAEFHAAGIEFPGQNVKCLFLRNRKGSRHYLLILDELKSADLAALASQLGETRLSFASEERLMAMLGLTPGSVTPFALADDREQRITVLLDDGIRQDDLVGFHPLVNSQTLCIRYADLLRYLAHTGHTPVRVTL
ncbi:hypothetical protein DK254_22480 [Pseudomonas sp. RW407]|uniref:prolyl-tRNA synthetase associated domain-containing protein n=1 Tax=Pseudomonas sp. RW407 TaxID=2202894 RepID=UPI000D6FD0EE|nr:prolyl-tRNA synthetase associated domain-containing protein [Pseudomonas sp. RW407]PWU28588.1 hypothetical protein DK254_22480 [Pseudomonas sp. RW407]